MLDYREELRKIKEEKLKQIDFRDPEDIFKKVFIPYFITLSVEQIEKGFEVFIHYHERSIIIGANKQLLLNEHNIADAKNVVKSLKKTLVRNNKDDSLEEYEDGFSFLMKA